MKTIYISILLLTSCSAPTGNTIIDTTTFDTVKPELKIQSELCADKFKGYFNRYGYTLSLFFEEIDHSFIDLDNDGIKDTLFILAPKNMLMPSENVVCENEVKTNRLLLINRNGSKFVFSNVIRNEFGIGTIGAEFIEPTENGFKLRYHKGQSCFLDYDINVDYYESNFYIDSIKLRSSCPGEEERIKVFGYPKKSFLLNTYKRTIIDSLENLNLTR